MKQRKEIKEVLEKILGSSLTIQADSRTEEDKMKEEFVSIIDRFEKVWKRQDRLDIELGIDFSTYDDEFFRVIESLICFSFDSTASEAILFYIYGKHDPEDKLIPYIDGEGKEHLLVNADDLWEYMLCIAEDMMST